jgi:hypothetical protein
MSITSRYTLPSGQIRLTGLLLTLLTAFFLLTSSGPAYSQSNTRSFQMALWDYACSVATPCPDANTDIATWWPTEGQPAGRSILFGWNWTVSMYTVPYDWSRIVAVEIDEPYTPVDGALDQTCGDNTLANTLIAPIDAALAQRAAELKTLNPRARFWVNFTAAEGQWMGFCATPQVFNRAYIDVISDDYYDVGFDFVRPFYTVLTSDPAKPPGQQFALIPGVFSAPTNQGQYLQSYFDYGDYMNQTCSLPLGSRGVTGIYDGCPVWVILGFLAPNNTLPNGTVYLGLLDPNSKPIATVWENQLALPLRPGLAHQRTRGQALLPALQPALQLLLK